MLGTAGADRRGDAAAARFGGPAGAADTFGARVRPVTRGVRAPTPRPRLILRGEHQVPDQAQPDQRAGPAAQQGDQVLAQDRREEVPHRRRGRRHRRRDRRCSRTPRASSTRPPAPPRCRDHLPHGCRGRLLRRPEAVPGLLGSRGSGRGERAAHDRPAAPHRDSESARRNGLQELGATRAGEGAERVAQIVGRAQAAIDEVLGRSIPSGAPVALLDIPTHANVGDHAITLGTFECLRRSGHAVQSLVAPGGYSPTRLRERVRDGVILLTGGGNLGDLWPAHQRFREQVLADFPDRQVVQLPQSIKFSSGESLESARRAFGSHPAFTLLVRDAGSLALAREQFGCAVDLCPDLALALGPQASRRKPDTDVLVLARTDHETTAPFRIERTASVDVVDWVEHASLRFHALRLLSRYESLAHERLEFGLSLLGRGRVVVTDRLHAHILCILLGIPHVIRDAGYGKLTAFHAAWTRDSPLVETCDTQEAALAAALRRVG